MSSDMRELVALPDAQKERLAYDLLVELGATHIKRIGDELTHPCFICPHHTDQHRNPTASLNWSKLVWNCLGGTGGSILWFIATARGGTIEQARQWLAGEAGLTRAMELPALLELFDALYNPKGAPPPPPTYSERILKPWQAGGIPLYILDRGVPRETAERAGLCTAPAGALTDPKDYPGAGPRLVIPHWWKGRLVGYQSRRLDDTDGTPKYLSTPGFPKDTTVYRLHEPAYRGRAVAVEAPASTLRHTHHQPMVGLFGAEITDRQLDLLAEYQEVVFWLDPDKAGWDATGGYVTDRGRRIPGKAEVLSRRTKVTVVESPYDADPADLDDTLVGSHLERPVPWPVWDRPKIDTLICHRCSGPSHPYTKCP